MRPVRIALVTAAVTCAVGALGFSLLLRVANRRLNEIDWIGFLDLLKVPLAAAATSHVVIELPPLSESGLAFEAGHGGWANAPRNRVEALARQTDTYLAALSVGHAAAKLSGKGASLPVTSFGLTDVEPRLRLDAWGHPFCLVKTGHAVAVISRGPSLEAASDCRDLEVSSRDLVKLERGRLYEYPSGTLVVITARP